MSAPARIPLEQLIENLHLLCAQPSSTGRDHELELTADLVQHVMQRSGLETRLVRTAGAPVVIGRQTGKLPFTLLLYHHYDTAPIGPWRAWHHDPHTLAERDGKLYARGIAMAKGPLGAHLSALAALLAAEQALPCSVIVVAEGEGLTGSPHLAAALASLEPQLRADACLASGGTRDARGWPYCYSGSKGLVRARLSVHGAGQALAPGLAAIVPNPIWRLIWALNSIKGEDEDIKINGFYDNVDGPSRETNRTIRKLPLDEAGRLTAWGLPQFMFGMSGGALTSAETTLPTCNLSAFTVEPTTTDTIPTQASALLDIQLVPQQQPGVIGNLLHEHLLAHGFTDVQCELLPGGYGAVLCTSDTPFVQQLASAGTQIFGASLPLLPMGPFALPLQLLKGLSAAMPVASIGCLRPGSGAYDANEHAPLDDLLHHGQLLMELMYTCGEHTESI